MARPADEPLSPREAKARLRLAAGRLSPALWVQRRPARAVIMSLVSGLLLSRAPRLTRSAGKAAARLLYRQLH